MYVHYANTSCFWCWSVAPAFVVILLTLDSRGFQVWGTYYAGNSLVCFGAEEPLTYTYVDAGTINDQVDFGSPRTSGRTPASASHFYKSLCRGDISTRLRSSTSVFHQVSLLIFNTPSLDLLWCNQDANQRKLMGRPCGRNQIMLTGQLYVLSFFR